MIFGAALATQTAAWLTALSLMVLVGLSKRRLERRPLDPARTPWWHRLYGWHRNAP